MAENCSPDTQVCQSNNTLEVVNSSGSLDESQVLQSTPASGKRKDIGWLEEYRAASMKRKMKDQDSPSTAKKESLADITKQTTNNGNSRNARTAKKKQQYEKSNKKNCTVTNQKPQTTDQKNADDEQKVAHSSEHKENYQPSFETSASLPAFITCLYQGEEEDIRVRKDEPIIDFIQNFKPVGKSVNILFYSHKQKATINPYVLCSAFGEDEKLEIIQKKRRKSQEGETDIPQFPASSYPASKRGRFINFDCTGTTTGGAARKILAKKMYSWKEKPLAVLGYPDQTIEDAIMNDKRFHITRGFKLKNPNTPEKKGSDLFFSSLSSEVVYSIQVDKKIQKTITKTHKTKKTNETNGDQTKQRKGSPNMEEINSDFPKTSPDPQSQTSEKTFDLPENYRLPNSERFSSDFCKISRALGEEQVKSDLINEYHQNVLYKTPMLASVLRMLTKHLDSVALIGHKYGNGTFFLLTENLGLTCHHVLEPLLKGLDWKQKPEIDVEIYFNYEMEPPQKQNCHVQVEYYNEESDFVFLRLLMHETNHQLGLLKYAAPPPEDGGVSIIGHHGVHNDYLKKIDIKCSVISLSKRAAVIAGTLFAERSYIHVLTHPNFGKMSNPGLVTYDTCLYFGASGGPVFNDEGLLVAMHTGGYPVAPQLKKKSVIEYGTNLLDILITGAIHIQDLQLWFREIATTSCNLHDYLREYLQPNGHSVKMQPTIREFLKTLE